VYGDKGMKMKRRAEEMELSKAHVFG